MSETTEQPGAPTPEPEPTPAPAPVESTPEPEPQETDTPPRREADEEGRRVAQLRARLGAAEREREAQRAELEFYRRQAQQQPPAEETPEQRMARIESEADARAEQRLLTRRFHEEGAAQYGDWKQRCDDLVAMGADAEFARLLVETPEGVRITAALAADPEAVQRITNLRSERARAVALGKYAATLDDAAPARAAPAAERQVTRAPPPIRPVTGRAAPQFNEYTADGQTLVDRYMKENIERQMQRR